MKTLIRFILSLIALFIIACGLLLAVTYYTYNPSQAATLPCRNCTAPAKAVTIDGFDLYYRETVPLDDDPTPVVLLHGGPGMSSDYFQDAFDFLAEQKRVIYYDQRGSGNSQIRPEISHYTIDNLVQELDSLREEVIGRERIILIGHSFGGALAQHYVLTHPAHVAQLILVSTASANSGGRTNGLLINLLNPLGRFLNSGWPPLSPEAANRWYAHRIKTVARQALQGDNYLDNLGYMSFATARTVVKSTWGFAYAEAWSKVDVPTLIMYGDLEFGWESRRLYEIRPEVEFVVIENSGHWAFFESPQVFQQIVSDFVLE